MTTKFLPAWKDEKGNRIICIAENHLFDTYDDAQKYQMSDFIFYVPMGITPDGIFEAEFEGTVGHFPHVLFDGPWRSPWAGIAGPAFDKAMAV